MFDSACNFCNAGVNFIIDNDPQKIFRFAALQSKAGKALLKKFNLSADALDTAALIENGKAHTKSSAALRIMRKLRQPFPLFSFLFLVPPFLRDATYDIVAKNRYRWFGRRDSCRIPSPELKSRFLD